MVFISIRKILFLMNMIKLRCLTQYFFQQIKKEKNGVLDQAGNPILPAKYDFIEDFDENYFFVRNEGKAGLSDKSGNIIVDLLFDRVHHYVTDTHAIVLFEEEWIKYNLETKEMISEEIIFKLVDEMPYYEKCADINISSYKEAKDCGDKRMLEYVYQNIQYPLEAREKGVQGVVVVKFIIDEEGNMNDIEIVKSVHESLDAVSLNITKSMSKRKWVPGKHGGQAVKVYFVFPIKFKLT